MKSTLSIAALAAASFAFASPVAQEVAKRDYGINDFKILNYALTLEHLENAFYKQGLENYTEAEFTDAGFTDGGRFYDNLREIAFDEQTHVDFLAKALGSKAVKPCTYSFPSTTPETFVALAAVLEAVGVSAYLGAAANITGKDYLTYAASILTVEARHSAYLRNSLGQLPFPSPFGTPLDFNEVYSLAASFIVSCPPENKYKPQIKFKAFPALSLVPIIPLEKVARAVILPLAITSGSTIELTTDAKISSKKTVYAAFLTIFGPIFVDVTRIGDIYSLEVPEGVNGQSYVVLVACKDYVSDDNILAGPAIIEVTNPRVFDEIK